MPPNPDCVAIKSIAEPFHCGSKLASTKDVMAKIRILLADDHQIFRQGLKNLLQGEADFDVVAEADHGRAVTLLYPQVRPSIILMDLAMPILNGIEASRQILREQPSARILILSAYRNDSYMTDLLELGIAGYLPKYVSLAVLSRAIRTIVGGETFFDVSTSPGLNCTPGAFLKQLSSREVEVLQLIAEGGANKQIADELNISIKTVEKHRQSVMNKLRIHETAGLTRYAISAGVIEHPMSPALSSDQARRA
jgi:DNA-binding NarL/FixJ family response regulator